MAKARSSFVCQQCGYKSPSYLGKCPNCEAWNSFVETIEKTASVGMAANRRERSVTGNVATRLTDVQTTKVSRLKTNIVELDHVLGGGLVPGSMVLLAGDPGIGKSTLTIQIVSALGGLYVSGEESPEQVKLRAQRLNLPTDKVFILAETNIESILDEAQKMESGVLIVDSIQTIWTEELTGVPGAVGQIRESTLKLLDFAKKNHISVILIGHVTKEGTIAGPRVLEHIVDTVLYLEGERFQSLRLLRATKNRFGPVDEVGVFSMEERGMMEVKNPSELFLNQEAENSHQGGRVIIATLEGTRPLLVEVQALTVSSQTPLPRRVGNGINNNRLQMLVAILQKHLHLPLGKFDIFVNVASGIKVFEPAADLGICLAIASSFKNKEVGEKTVVIGEVGLLGEIRNVIGLDRRIKESKRLGFKTIISPKEYTHISKVIKEVS